MVPCRGYVNDVLLPEYFPAVHAGTLGLVIYMYISIFLYIFNIINFLYYLFKIMLIS